MNQRTPIVAWGLFVFLALVWGSSFILMKRGLEVFTPLQVAALRLVIAGGILFPLVWDKARQLSRREWQVVLTVGFIGNAIPAFLFPLAETQINSATAGILNALSPLFVLVLGLAFFGARFSGRQTLGVLIGFAGALVLVLGGAGPISLGGRVGYTLLVVLATAGYGLSTNLMKRYLNHTPALLASGFALLGASLPYLVYLVFFSGVGKVMQTPGAWTGLGYIAILGAVGTASALIAFYRLVQLTDPIFSSSVTYLIPLVALGWGMLDGERLEPLQYLGMGVILVGVYLANRKAKAASSPAHRDHPHAEEHEPRPEPLPRT